MDQSNRVTLSHRRLSVLEQSIGEKAWQDQTYEALETWQTNHSAYAVLFSEFHHARR